MRHRPHIIAVFLIIAICMNIIFPAPAEAGLSIKRFGRWLGERAQDVVELPGKVAGEVTRPLGPVVGPLVAEALTAQMLGNPKVVKVLRRARTIKRVSDDVKFLDSARNAMRQFYTEQAQRYREQAAELEKQREQIRQNLATDPNTLKTYINMPLEIEARRNMAAMMENAANSVHTRDIVRMFGQRVARSLGGEIKGIVINESTKEIQRILRPDVIKIVNAGGVDPLRAIDQILEGDIDRTLRGMGYADTPGFDELKDRIKERIKEAMQRNRDYYRDNWREEIRTMVKEETTKGGDDASGGKDGAGNDDAGKGITTTTTVSDGNDINEMLQPDTGDGTATTTEARGETVEKHTFPFEDRVVDLAITDPAIGKVIVEDDCRITVKEDGSMSAIAHIVSTNQPKEHGGGAGYDAIEGLSGENKMTTTVDIEFTGSRIDRQSEQSVNFVLTGTYTLEIVEEGEKAQKSSGRASLSGGFNDRFRGSGRIQTPFITFTWKS